MRTGDGGMGQPFQAIYNVGAPEYPDARGAAFQTDHPTREIIQAVIKVHQTLGPGFLESIYHAALVRELSSRGLAVETEKSVPIYYEGAIVGTHRLDLLVQGRVIVELKAVDVLLGVHYAQLRSYLKASGLETGILVNFAGEKADFRRVQI